ncbi:MAG: WD40/YVTN/BNR-like repeat-containing protein [Limisphaerales bacterium]
MPRLRHRRYTLSLLAVLFGGMAAPAPDLPLRWRWSNPRPHGNNLNDLAVRSGRHVAVGDRGRVYASEDLASWTVLPTPTTRQLRAVTFFGARIIATGEAGTILYSQGSDPFSVAQLNPPTEDWLEGIAASPTLAVAVGDNGAIYTSVTAFAWQRASVPFAAWLRAVAWGNNVFVAVGEDGFAASSADGRNWQSRNSRTTGHLNRVVWDGARFLAASARGSLVISTDGVNWLLDTGATGTTNELNALAVGGGRQLLAGDDVLRTRAAVLQPWGDEFGAPQPPPRATYLSAAWNGTSLLAGGRAGLLVEGFRTNNATQWTDLSTGVRHWLWDASRFPDTYVAVGDRATILSSPDGVNWSPELPPLTLTNAIFLGLGGRTNLAIAVGSGGALMISPAAYTDAVVTNAAGAVITNRINLLGLEWQAVNSGVTNALQGVAADQARILVVGDEGAVITSADGTNWSARVIPERPLLTSVAAHPGGYVAVGRAGALFTSPDAVTWTRRDSSTTNWLYRVRWLNGLLLAMGQAGTLLVGTNGLDWTPRVTGTTAWINDAAYADGAWFLVGNQGTALFSTNAVDWTDAGSITGKSLYAAATHEGQLVVAGIEGLILRAQLTPLLDPVEIAAFDHQVTTNLVRDSLLFIGRPDQQFDLDRAAELETWRLEQRLEITAPDGAVVYIRETTNPPPEAKFYRTVPVR